MSFTAMLFKLIDCPTVDKISINGYEIEDFTRVDPGTDVLSHRGEVYRLNDVEMDHTFRMRDQLVLVDDGGQAEVECEPNPDYPDDVVDNIFITFIVERPVLEGDLK